jgi:predicted Zn-dependent protease
MALQLPLLPMLKFLEATKMSFNSQIFTGFQELAADLKSWMTPGECFVLTLRGEDSLFTRFNCAQVRQSGTVRDVRYELKLFKDGRNCWQNFPGTGEIEIDRIQAQLALADLRAQVLQLSPDPYLVLPSGQANSVSEQQGQLLAPEVAAASILSAVAGLDFTGLYAGGTSLRGYADSNGQQHWFSADTFTLDYSLFTSTGQAVKGTYAGSTWEPAKYQEQIDRSRQQLKRLQQTPKSIQRGKYRTYLAPAAVADLVSMLSWGGVSEADLQQGQSSLAALRDGRHLSSLFAVTEDFTGGLVPRFNQLGEVASDQLPIIADGQLLNTLVSSRSASEYGKAANGANDRESLRSPVVATGKLSQAQILAELDTGLYLSNLHYLNWSDRQSGRVTGMTRYACFWVENGEIVMPIENLRFDDSLYDFWGDNLLAVTNFSEYIATVDSYGGRSLGGAWVPGMLIQDFTYTL